MKTSYNPNGNQLFAYDEIKSWQDLTDAEIEQSLHIAKPIFGNLISFEGTPYKINALLKYPTECCIAFTMKYFFRQGVIVAVDMKSDTSADLYAAQTTPAQYWYGCIKRLKNFIKNDVSRRDLVYSPRYS